MDKTHGYSHIQCIGFNIHTYRDSYNTTSSKRIESTQRLKDGCTLLKRAIQVVDASSSIDRSSQVLKLFMAPEYFFQTWDAVYHPIENLSMIPESMAELAKHPHFSDWLFVYGTAVSFVDSPKKREIHNVAFIQRGGNREDGLQECVVYKEFPTAQEDYSAVQEPNTPFAGASFFHRVTPIKQSRTTSIFNTEATKEQPEKSEINRSGLGGGGIFTMADVTFGLEICADHNLGRLARYQRAPGEPTIQALLIPSCGMTFQRKDKFLDTDRQSRCHDLKGLAFNVDGARGGSTLFIGDKGSVTEREPIKFISLGEITKPSRKGVTKTPISLSIFMPEAIPTRLS